MKKFIYIILSIAVLVSVYLFWSHWFIYYQLGKIDLQIPNTPSTYLMGTQQKTDEALVYVALGDSLTSGLGVTDYAQSYPYLVADKLAKTTGNGYSVSNLSFPGYRIIDLINNLLPSAIEAQPDLVTILIGVNDIHGAVSKVTFEKAYRHILTELTQKTTAKIYLISIPFIGSETLLMPPYNSYFQEQTEDYNKIVKQLADEYHLVYIDVYTPTLNLFQKDGSHYSTDSFHPSAEGYSLWAEIIYDALNR
jgi:lysophospholipase L1-like esterase